MVCCGGSFGGQHVIDYPFISPSYILCLALLALGLVVLMLYSWAAVVDLRQEIVTYCPGEEHSFVCISRFITSFCALSCLPTADALK